MIDWLKITTIPLWAGHDLNDKTLLILSDGNITKLFYHLPFIVEKAQIASRITICCPTTCVKILQKTFEKDNVIDIIAIDSRLVAILHDEKSYDYMVAMSQIDYPYKYNPILAYPPRSIYQEKIGNQIIDKLICGVAFEDQDRQRLIAKNDICQLLYQLHQYCHLYSYDYHDILGYADYCIGNIFFNPDDIIDLTASYISMSDVIIAYDNLIASMAVAMGKYVVVLADVDGYEKLLTINHPNVTIINIKNYNKDTIIEKIITAFLKYQQQVIDTKAQRQQQIITRSLNGDDDGKGALVNQCAHDALFKEAFEVLKTIPNEQRKDNDWHHLITGGVLVQDYQLVYDLLTEKSPFDDLTAYEQQQIFISVQNLKNYEIFVQYALARYGDDFPNIGQLDDSEIIKIWG